jgi:hypothetical protein
VANTLQPYKKDPLATTQGETCLAEYQRNAQGDSAQFSPSHTFPKPLEHLTAPSGIL